MKEKLQKLLNNSYSPYSKFRVAAIVTMKDASEFYGVNVENASYGATICAERSAIVSAISHGYKIGDFDSIAIMVDDENISTCCFICRQLLVEFFSKDSTVVCFNNKGESKTYKISELCPHPFSIEDLK
ncbi:MAG TPA: cytidine deaminase [Tenericutes bacterium]|nr:cytidine deaminase [Mycoplasmatota bacterium]